MMGDGSERWKGDLPMPARKDFYFDEEAEGDSWEEVIEKVEKAA